MATRDSHSSPGCATARVAKAGQAAWFFGNLYEAVVGVPQLLGWARAERSPGLLSTGSPVRYFAPIAPLTLGSTTLTLIQSWRSGEDRYLIATAAGCFLGALGLSGYLIGTVNLPLLANGDSLTAIERSQLAARWHRVNALRLLLLGAGLLVDPSR